MGSRFHTPAQDISLTARASLAPPLILFWEHVMGHLRKSKGWLWQASVHRGIPTTNPCPPCTIYGGRELFRPPVCGVSTFCPQEPFSHIPYYLIDGADSVFTPPVPSCFRCQRKKGCHMCVMCEVVCCTTCVTFRRRPEGMLPLTPLASVLVCPPPPPPPGPSRGCCGTRQRDWVSNTEAQSLIWDGCQRATHPPALGSHKTSIRPH